MTDDPTPDRTAEHERTLLACALQNTATARELLGMVQSPMFADPKLGRAWSALRRVVAAEDAPGSLPEAVSGELAGEGGDAPSRVELHSLTAEVLSTANATWYARRVLDAYVRRTAAGMLGEKEMERNHELETSDLLVGIEERIRHLRELLTDGEVRLLPEALTGAGWDEDPPPREWLVDGWLPAGELALLAGPGNAGKGLLSVQLGAALACNRNALHDGWLPAGAAVQAEAPALCADPCTVVLAGWEDDRSELLRRRHRLSMYGGCQWARDESINSRLHAFPMNTPVWEATRGGEALTSGGMTPSGTALLEYAEHVGARLLVVDPTGIAMALPEIDRAAVSLALGTLRRWAQVTGVTVLLVGHPAKASEGEASDYSGSTAWLGSVRTLLTLRTPPTKGEAAADRNCEQWRTLAGPDGYERVALLARRKNNYGPSGDAITVATCGGGAGWYLTDPLPAPSSKRERAAEANDSGKVDVVERIE